MTDEHKPEQIVDPDLIEEEDEEVEPNSLRIRIVRGAKKQLQIIATKFKK
jgi:hypothetical protein